MSQKVPPLPSGSTLSNALRGMVPKAAPPLAAQNTNKHSDVLREGMEALQGELGALRAELHEREIEHGESLGGLALSVVEAKSACQTFVTGAARELSTWRDSLLEFSQGSAAAAASQVDAREALEQARVAVQVGAEEREAKLREAVAAAGAEATVLAGRVATLEAALGQQCGLEPKHSASSGSASIVPPSIPPPTAPALALHGALVRCVEVGVAERASLEGQLFAARKALLDVCDPNNRPMTQEEASALQEALGEALARV